MSEIDLNLLKAFVLLYETRSVTRTAESLFVTQPAVSHSLRRLRQLFNDDLFVRGKQGLTPTRTATGAYPRLQQALQVVEETVQDVREFDPATSTRTFSLRVTDLGEVYLLPDILAAIELYAPRATLQVDPFDLSTAAEELRHGHADAVICTPHIDAPNLQRDPLLCSSYVGLCATTHPTIGPIPTLEEFLAERHILVDPAAGHAHADAALTALGYQRDIAVRVPHFAALPELVARTRCLAVAPSGIAELFTRTSKVRTFALPVSIPAVQVSLYTHRRSLPSPAIDWLRGVMTNLEYSVA